jgi:hypothetical protein
MSNSYPVGSVIVARFAFVNRPLTPTETSAFLAGNGLPATVGLDPDDVFFEYKPPGLTLVELEGGEVINDGVGEYHAEFALTVEGVWRYRGRGTDALGAPVAATPDMNFLATRSF